MRISIVMPVLDEAAELGARLAALQALRAQGVELVIVDGGSRDATVAVARAGCDRLVVAPRGRAVQMNAGAAAARGDVLWFVHADTGVPLPALTALLRACGQGAQWGRFDVRLSGRSPLLRVIATAMNLRSRLTGIATGDQGLFVRRALFERIGGYPPLALMEDIALSVRLKRVARPACLRPPLTTSSRRWERDGILRTVVLMWRLRFAYWRGADPAELRRRYYGD